MKNYNDVLWQIREAGILVDRLQVTGEFVRARLKDDQEKRGWYVLYEIPSHDGGMLVVGSFGVWRGLVNNAQKVELSKDYRLSDDQIAALREQHKAAKRRAEASRKRSAAIAARRAELVWRKCLHSPPDGVSFDYLERKGIGAHGVRYTDTGAIVIPMHDALGKVHGLQFILSKLGHANRIRRNGNRDKEYWPKGLAKKGHFFLIGSPKSVLLICEGYATAATLHEATGYPVAVAFDAGNLLPAAQALRGRYPRVRFLVCADDDYLTDGNPGFSSASAVTTAVAHTSWVGPRFLSDRDGAKLTDFNDLHSVDGMLIVRTQIEDKVRELGWEREKPRADQQGGEGRAFAFDLDDVLRDFSLVYGTNTVFDNVRKKIIELGPLGAAAGRPLVRNWLEHPDRRVVLPEQVGFDPSEQDEDITCNLWGGWPTKPGGNGTCDMLLELLEYLTSGEEGTVKSAAGEDVSRSDELYRWIIKWLAYPIQYPGAKMQTSVLVHGPEGTGKNTFFAAVRKIYGKYGTQFGQTELDSQFNGWASGKLFAIGNEVVSRAELYHVQGKLKNWVTEPEWQINEKMLPTRAEQNHCNFVFFSNRIDIAKLDNGDRRYCVVWTPRAKPADFYRQVGAEIAAGGVGALHDYLLNVDLTGFDVHAKPPDTVAKDELIELGMDSTERFFRDWMAGEISGVPAVPCKSTDLYDFYRAWATREGISRAAQKQTLLTAIGKKEGVEKRKARWKNGVEKQGMVVFPPGHWDDAGGRSMMDYLGTLISDFSSAVSVYRDNLS